VASEAEIEAEEEGEKNHGLVIKVGMTSFCLVLMITLIFSAIYLRGHKKDDLRSPTKTPAYAPSAPPTSETFIELLQTLRPLYPTDEMFEEAFSDLETPQYKAAYWASTTGSIGLSGSDARMISRFALATFFYSTKGEKWTRCHENLKTCGPGYWLDWENECEWFSVSCQEPNDGEYMVTELRFGELCIACNFRFPLISDPDTLLVIEPQGGKKQDLKGTLPLEMAFLSGLQRIFINEASISGSIPEGWSAMTALRTLTN